MCSALIYMYINADKVSLRMHLSGDAQMSDENEESLTPFFWDREEDFKKDDNRNVLERMEKSYVNGPLEVLYRCTKEQLKLKIWTRNFKEVRGICTGFPVAFDKHWNIALQDVDEICLKPKKGKTPYLRHLNPGDMDTIPEAQPKVPKEKKKVPEEVAAAADNAAAATAEPAGEDVKPPNPEKKRRKKKKSKITKRHVGQLFIRGDNVVMVAVISPTTE